MTEKVLKIKKITPEILDSINSEKYSEVYLEWLENNKNEYLYNNQIKTSIIKNINTPINLLLEFYKTDKYNTEILIESIIRKLIDLDDIIYLKELFFQYENDKFIIEAISQNKILDRELIDLIIKNHTNFIINLINNDKLTLDEIIKINDNSSYGLKEDAYNYLETYVLSVTSSERLEKLMDYTSRDINYFIAQNKYISDDLFNLLSLSTDFRTRTILAERVDTPIDILYYFLDDESDTVRLALAKNINIDKKILFSLAVDNKATIIKEIIKHVKTDKDVLNVIINKKDVLDSIKKQAKEQLYRLDNLYVNCNFDYYEIIELLKSEKISKIEINNKVNSDDDRKKITVELNDVL